MKFPVDVLAAVSHSELEQRAQSYMKDLLYSDPDCPEQLTLADSTQVNISISSVGLVPLYGSCDTQKVLALFAPADPITPVALYLLDQWWTVSDVLHTADSWRDGLVQVETLGEKIVLYVLNRIVYRVQEMSSDELPFLCHGEDDFAKILWKNGEAVGFYSVKATGSPCSSFSSRTYPLPVMDSLFVRKCHRGKGHGLRMLEDYVDSFKEDNLGLRYPLTTAMYKVCQCYLQAFPGDSELLWEVDSSRINQRTSIANKIHSMSLRGVSRTLSYSTESAVTGAVHHTEENVEEVIIVKATKGAGPAGQFSTDQIRISEEVTLLRVQNTELVQTEELLEVTTENETGIVATELEEDAVFDKVSSLRSEEGCLTLDSEGVTKSLDTLCSSVITVENVAAEVEECLPSQEQCEKMNHETAPPEGTVTVQRILRTYLKNIPQPSTVGDADTEKPVDHSEITQELKNEEDVTIENQTKNEMEETQMLHRIPLRSRHSFITTPKPTSVSMRLSKVQESAVTADTQEHGADKGDRAEKHENTEIDDAVEETGVKECLAIEVTEVTNEEENQEEIDIVIGKHSPSQEEQSKECVAPEILSEAVDNDDPDFETEIPTEVLQLASSQIKDPKKTSVTAAADTAETSCVTTTKHKSLSSTRRETEEVVKIRALRSGARPTSTVLTPRTTRSRKQEENEIVETTAIRQAKGSIGRKGVRRSKAQTQELEAFSAEDDTTDQMSKVTEDGTKKDEVVDSEMATETSDTVSKVVSKEQESDLGEDTLREEVKGKADITAEEAAVVECTSAEAVVDEKIEEASTADVESVLLTTPEAEGTEGTESTIEMDKDSQPAAVVELNVEESDTDKEPEPESVSEEVIETTPTVETRSLRSGPETVTAIPKHRHTAGNQTFQPETQEERQNEQDSTEEQSKEYVAPDISPEAEDKDDAQSETQIGTEVLQLAPSQAKDAQKPPEEASDKVVVTEQVPSVAPVEQENLSSCETEEVVETRALRSGARPTSTVSIPRTTRRSKQKAEEEIVEKTTMKQAKKSSGRKRVSRSKAQTQELEASSAEDDTRQEAHTETYVHTMIEKNEISSPAKVDNEGASNDKPVKESELTVATETQDTVSKEVSKEQECALVEEETLHKDNEEVEDEIDITVEQTAAVESTSAREEATSTADVESVLLKAAEAEGTEKTESTMEMDKDSQSEAVMELSVGESSIDKEPEADYIPAEPIETTPIVETRFLRSGPKILTATPRRRHTAGNQTVQSEMPYRLQEESQNEQNSTEEQSKECVAPDIPSEAEDKNDAQSEAKITTEVLQLAPSQTKDVQKAPEEASDPSAIEEAPVASVEQENLLCSETDEEFTTRALRSGTRPIGSVSTPRTTRRSKQKVEEVIVEKTNIKQVKKSTGSKRVSRSKPQTQEFEASSAENDTIEEVQIDRKTEHTTIENNEMSVSREKDENEFSKDNPIKGLETTVSKEDSKEHEPVLVEDTLHLDDEEVKGEADVTVEGTAVVGSTSAEAVEEERIVEAASTANVESVLLSTTEAEDTEQTESTKEMDKESQRKAVMELSAGESGIDKEIVHPETQDRPREEPQKEEDSTDKQSKEYVAPDIPSEAEDKDDVQSETKITTEVLQLVPSQTKDAQTAPEEASDEAVATEEVPVVAPVEQENLPSSENEKVVQTRALRSGARPTSTVSPPRTTRHSKRKAVEVIVEKTTIKQAKKSTGRKQVSRSKAQTQELEASSAEDDIDNKGANNNERDSESKVATEIQDTVSKEVSKEQEPALVEDTLHIDDEEVKGEKDVTVEETAVVGSTSADTVEEERIEEAASTVNVESVLLSTTKAEDTEQTESTMEMDKESQRKAVMELSGGESGIDKETVLPETQDRLQKQPQKEQDSIDEQSKECVAPDIPSVAEDKDDSQSETKIPTEVLQLAPSQTAPEEASDEAVAIEEVLVVSPVEQENLPSIETEEVVEIRALRSGARPISAVSPPRTTRHSKRKAVEVIVEKTTIKQAKKSTGRKQVTRSMAQTQELEASSAENDIDNKGANNNERDSESKMATEIQDTVSKEVSKEQEPALVEEDTLHKEEKKVEGAADITVKETTVVDSTNAEVVEEKRIEESSSTADVESVLRSTTEAEGTEVTETIMEMDKESQPEVVMELSVRESGIDKEPEPESVPEEPIEVTPIKETRSLRSGPKTVTATPKRRHTAGNQTVKPETPDTPQEEPQKEQDSTEEQSKECVAPDIPFQTEDKDDAQSETRITTEILQLAPFQTKDAQTAPEEASDEAVATEEVPVVAPVEQENLPSSETEEVVETRALRSGARPISVVSPARTTRHSKRNAVEVIVEKTTIKQAKKSTGRKQVTRSMAQTQELEASSEENDIDNKGANNNERDSESKMATEIQDTVSKEVSKEQEPALVEEDTLHKEEKKVEGAADITVKETTVVDSTNAEVVEEKRIEESSSTADVESVLRSTTEAEGTEVTETIMEMDKESQPEVVMELSVRESGIDKEPEPESVPEEPIEVTPIKETRSLRSGPKTVTATPKRRHTAGNQTVKPETPDTPQEEPQKEQDSTEEQSKECVAPDIPFQTEDKDDAQSETRITTEILQLAPFQTKDAQTAPEEASDEAVATEEVPVVAPVEQENLPSSETEEVVETRALRSGARPISVVSPARTTRHSKRKAVEVIVEKTTIKQAKKSTGRKRVSRSKAQIQELEASSAEDDIDNKGANNNERDSESKVATEIQDTVSKEVSKEQEPALVEEDTLHIDDEEVKGEAGVTVEETAVVESTSAEAVEEERLEEAASTVNVESVLLSTTEAEDTEQAESTKEIDKESQRKAVMELSGAESGIDKETVQPETQDRPREEPQKEQDSIDEQSKECVAPNIPSEAEDKDDAQSETNIPTEVLQLVPSQTKDAQTSPEEASDEAVASEEVPVVSAVEQENLPSSETKEVVETRALRSGARPISAVSPARTTRHSKRNAVEVIVEKTTIKQAKKSTGRKRVSRSKAKIQELEASSAEDDIDNKGANNNERDSESKVATEIQDTVSKEVSKEQEPALVEDTLHLDDEEVKGEKDVTVEETAVVGSTSAEAVEEERIEEAASTVNMESVLLSTTEAEDTKQTESTMEMDKESQRKAVMELSGAESGIDKETVQPETQDRLRKEPQKPDIPSEAEDKDDAQSETKIPTEVLQLAPSQTAPEEASDEAVAIEEVLVVSPVEQENLPSSETEEVVGIRALRSGARSTSVVSPPRTTRHSKRKAVEVIVEKTTIKQAKKSTGRKRVSRSKAQIQELEASSAEDDIDNKGANNNERDSESKVATEIQDTVSKEVSKEQEPALVEDTLHIDDEEVKGEKDVTVEETAVVGSTSAEAVEEERLEEAASTVNMESVLLSTTEAEDTKQTESTMEMDKESQRKAVMELCGAESGIDKETVQPETQDRPREEPQKEQDSTDEQSKECVTPNIPSEAEDKDDAQSETNIPTEVLQLVPSQTKDAQTASEEASDEAVATEEVPIVSAIEQENLPSSETEEVVETRALRSGARPISAVSPGRTTRHSTQNAVEVIVEKTTIKQAKKSTGRKRVSRSKAKIQELEASSAEDDIDNKGANNNERDSESKVATEIQDTVSKEVSKEQEPALVEDTLHIDDEEVKGEKDITVEETAVVGSTSAEAVEEERLEEAASTVNMESVLLSTTEAEDTKQTESTMEMDKESQRKAVMELCGGESGIDKKTVQPETQDRLRKEPQKPDIPSEAEDKDDAQSKTKIPTKVLQLVPSQTAPEEASDEAVAIEQVLVVSPVEQENLPSSETKEVVEIRALRSGARPTSTVSPPRTTRHSKRKAVEVIVEKTTIKQAKKSTGRKRVSRSKAQIQELEASSAEDDIDNKGANNNERDSESKVATEIQDTVSKEVSKEQEPTRAEDTLHKEEEEVKGETDITVQETAVVDSTNAEVVEEKRIEESSTADVESVLRSTTEAEGTEVTESIMEMDKESQPEAVMELSVGESGIDKEPEPESVPEEPIEVTPMKETRSLRSGSKTVTATPKRRHTAGNQTIKPETPDTPQEEPQKEQDSTEEQSKECVAPDIPFETEDQDDTQSETKITTEVLQLAPSQTKDAQKNPEEASDKAFAAEEVPSVAPVEQDNLSSSETEEVVETRALRSGARLTCTVSTPRTTRRSKRKAVEVIVEKPIKQAKKSTGRKRVRRSKAQTLEFEASSAEDDTTEETHIEISGQTTIENNEMSSPAEVDNAGANNDGPVKESESKVATEIQNTVAKEVSKEKNPALAEEETFHKEVKSETDIPVEETAVVESTSSEAVVEEKRKEALSTADVESVLLSTAEAKGTEQTESTIEMDKESQSEDLMELSVGESNIDKEPEPDSFQEEPIKITSIIETRSLRTQGPKTVTAIPKSRHTAGIKTVQPETQDRPQEKTPKEQDSTEEQSKEVAETSSDVVDDDDDDDAHSERKITTEVPLCDLPRVAVVLVDVKKVQVLMSITETAALDEMLKQEEHHYIQNAVESNQPAKEVETDKEEGNRDHTTTQVPLLESTGSSSNEADGRLPEKASLVSPTTTCVEDDLVVPVTTSSKRTRQSDIQREKPNVEDSRTLEAHDNEIQRAGPEDPHTSQTPRRSSRKRPKVDYRDEDDKLDSSESLALEDPKVFEKDSLMSMTCASEPQSEEGETSEGIVLSLRLDEEDEQSASDEELIVITGKNLRSRSVPSLIISPHSKPTPLRSTVTPKESPEQTPRQKRRSAKTSPSHTSKRPRK